MVLYCFGMPRNRKCACGAVGLNLSYINSPLTDHFTSLFPLAVFKMKCMAEDFLSPDILCKVCHAGGLQAPKKAPTRRREVTCMRVQTFSRWFSAKQREAADFNPPYRLPLRRKHRWNWEEHSRNHEGFPLRSPGAGEQIAGPWQQRLPHAKTQQPRRITQHLPSHEYLSHRQGE